MIVHKYKIYCETDSKWEYVWAHEDDPAPTKCPVDHAHTVTDGSASVDKTINDNIQKTQAHIGADSIKLCEFGYNFTSTKTSITDHDILLPVSRLRGAWVECQDHVFGDQITVQVVDVDNVLGQGAGYVVDEFGKDVQIASNGIYYVYSEAITSPIPAGLYFRLKFESVGTVNDVKVRVNCRGYNDIA